MKKTVSYISSNPLLSGGAVIMSASLIVNVTAYLYHLILGRLAGPILYGELTTAYSIWNIFTALFGSFGMVIVKFVAGQDKKQVSSVFNWLNRDLVYILLTISVLFAIFSPFLANLLHISWATIALISPIIFFSILALLYGALLQGQLKFGQSVGINIASVVLRLIFGVILFLLGLKVFGIIAGLLFATIGSFLMARFFVSKLHLPKLAPKADRVKIAKFALPVAITALSLGSIFSSDMILVKHYFDAHTAGIYGSLSVLGKIIFYLTSPIVGVMFPLAVSKRAKGEKTLNTFLLSILFSGLLSFMALMVYAIFPKIVITTLYGDSYTEGVSYLLPFGIFAALYSLIAYTINYLLSLEYTFASLIIALAAVMQIIGIMIFHSTIYQVVNVSIVVSFIFLVILLFYGLMKYQKIGLKFLENKI